MQSLSLRPVGRCDLVTSADAGHVCDTIEAVPETSDRPRLSRRVAAIEESATLAVDAKAKSLVAAGHDVIGFGAGEPDFPTPAHIVAAAIEAAPQPKNHRYTPAGGLPDLKEAVAVKTAKDSG